MGRQSARLLYQGNDHKNIYFQTDNEPTISGKTLRMHFQMYKGSELVWEKLPPNFMLFGNDENEYESTHVYESVTGRKFDDLGWIKDNEQKKFRPMHIRKIKNRLFVCSYNSVFYSDNWFSWKILNSNIYNGETLLDIENHNDKLLIYTTKNLFLYDMDLKEKEIVYSFENESDLPNLTNIEFNASKGDTTVVVHRFSSSTGGSGRQLITIKNSNVVKVTETSYENSFVIASNENYFVLLADAYILNPYMDEDDYDPYDYIYSSHDGITWNRKSRNDYLDVRFAGIPLFFKDRFYYISNYDNEFKYILSSNKDGSGLEKIDYKIDLTSYTGGLLRNFCMATDDYVYFLKMDTENNQYYLIRFEDFYSDAYETVIENSRIYAGVYSVFDENKETT